MKPTHDDFIAARTMGGNRRHTFLASPVVQMWLRLKLRRRWRRRIPRGIYFVSRTEWRVPPRAELFRDEIFIIDAIAARVRGAAIFFGDLGYGPAGPGFHFGSIDLVEAPEGPSYAPPSNEASKADSASEAREGVLDMTEMKAKLRNLPDEDPVVQAFAAALADRLNDRMAPEGVNMMAELLINDIRSGKSGFAHLPLPRALVGLPGNLCDLLDVAVEHLLTGTFPPAFAEQVSEVRRVVAAMVAR